MKIIQFRGKQKEKKYSTFFILDSQNAKTRRFIKILGRIECGVILENLLECSKKCAKLWENRKFE